MKSVRKKLLLIIDIWIPSTVFFMLEFILIYSTATMWLFGMWWGWFAIAISIIIGHPILTYHREEDD